MTAPDHARALAEQAIRLAEKATPGPWQTGVHRTPYPVVHGAAVGDEWMIAEMRNCDRDDSRRAIANAALIAHAGTHYATLARAYLSLADRERRAVELLREHVAAEHAYWLSDFRGVNLADDPAWQRRRAARVAIAAFLAASEPAP